MGFDLGEIRFGGVWDTWKTQWCPSALCSPSKSTQESHGNNPFPWSKTLSWILHIQDLLLFTHIYSFWNWPHSMEEETRGGLGVWGLTCEFETKTCSGLTSVEFVGSKAQMKSEDGVQFGLCLRCVGRPWTGYWSEPAMKRFDRIIVR